MFSSALTIATACAACSSNPAAKIDPRGLAVIERTQRTTSEYSVFAWNDVPEGQKIKDGWSAEFHSGDLHRVETPMSRSVADCRRRTGTHLDLTSGKMISNQTVANAACGINTNFAFRAVEWLGRQRTAFGDADRVRVTDDSTIRTYDVLDNGALAESIYFDREGKPIVANRALAIENKVPEGIFTPQSLNQSFVPEDFRSPSPRN